VTSKPDFSLEGKIILITGASSGLGKGLAAACAASGAELILFGRDKTRLEETARECACAGGGGCLEIRLHDLSAELDRLPQLARELVKRHGAVDGLVHCAGLLKLTPLQAFRAESAVELFQVNALAGIMLTKGLLLARQIDRPVSVVFMSSVMGRVGKPGRIAYGLSKGALEAAVKSLALELIPENIRVNAVAPAVIKTKMIEEYFDSIPEATKNGVLAEMPMGLGTIQDIASAIVFLLSDASRYITGTSLLVDGGYCAQ
jgi:NAD(P)-dependent dehydrogenase (short-subunit alcohol dehydrogenase family)